MRIRLFILISFFLLSGCIEFIAASTLTTGYIVSRKESPKQTLIDTKIQTDITAKLLFRNLHGMYSRVNVNVYSGRVLLTGYVSSMEAMQEVMEVAWASPQTKEVINEISTENEAKKRNHVMDNLIADRVKAKFMLNKNIKSFDIDLDVYDRVVYMLGSVGSEAENREAAGIAARIKGVKKVVSHLRTS